MGDAVEQPLPCLLTLNLRNANRQLVDATLLPLNSPIERHLQHLLRNALYELSRLRIRMNGERNDVASQLLCGGVHKRETAAVALGEATLHSSRTRQREEAAVFGDHLHVGSLLRDLRSQWKGETTVRTSLFIGSRKCWLSFLHSARVYYVLRGREKDARFTSPKSITNPSALSWPFIAT